MSDRELLPCPFCGGSDIRITQHGGGGVSPAGYAYGAIYSMCCYNCGATFPNRYERELMVKAWNRRARLSEPGDVVTVPRDVENVRDRLFENPIMRDPGNSSYREGYEDGLNDMADEFQSALSAQKKG